MHRSEKRSDARHGWFVTLGSALLLFRPAMRTLLIAVAFLASVSLAQPSPLGTARVENAQVTIDRGQGAELVDARCNAIAAVIDQQLHVACDDGRIKTFSLEGTPALVSEARVEGEFRSLFLHDGQAWVEVAKVEARPLRQAAVPVTAAGPVTVRPVAAPVTTTGEPGDTILGPVRPTGFIVAGGLRVMVPIGVLAIGGALEASFAWHAEVPFAVRVRLFPLAGVSSTGSFTPLGSSSGVGLAAGSLEAMFDGRYFAAGLGIGFGQFTNFSSFNGSVSYQAGFTISQVLRVGALDGLYFGGQTQLVVTDFGFNFYGGEATLQIPITRKWLLQFRGGGSTAPFAFGDIGMRIGVGDAERAKLFLVPTVGVTYIRFVAGPSVGLGVEYRF